MTLGIGHLTLVSTAPAPSGAATQRPAPALQDAPPPEVTLDVIGSTPPPEALEAVDRAAEAAEWMASQNRELHFEKDPHSGRIIVQIRDLDGNVIETIPARDALDLLS